MVATRGRTFKRPWRRSCHSSKLKSSSAPIGRKDSWCFHAVGSSNAPLLGSTAAEGFQRIGRTSTATRWRSCGLPQSASCSENFVIPPDVFGQTLRHRHDRKVSQSSILDENVRHLGGQALLRYSLPEGPSFLGRILEGHQQLLCISCTLLDLGSNHRRNVQEITTERAARRAYFHLTCNGRDLGSQSRGNVNCVIYSRYRCGFWVGSERNQHIFERHPLLPLLIALKVRSRNVFTSFGIALA